MMRTKWGVMWTLALTLTACAGTGVTPSSDGSPPSYQPAAELDWRKLPPPDHTLANFRPGETPDYCFDRATQPYTAVVDSHFHPKPESDVGDVRANVPNANHAKRLAIKVNATDARQIWVAPARG